MGARIKPVPARAPIRAIRRVHILEALSLILEYARIFESGAVFQPRDIADEHAGSASLQTTYKDILAGAFHRRAAHGRFRSHFLGQFSHAIEYIGCHRSLLLKHADKDNPGEHPYRRTDDQLGEDVRVVNHSVH